MEKLIAKMAKDDVWNQWTALNSPKVSGKEGCISADKSGCISASAKSGCIS
ncbi:hypothetical protein AB0I84_33065 [Streptomyces spectabilis]|uniref:hypothetical protein n=1 Tax=Streptomyces TaxID=1883 RepID=UPI000AF2A79B|nr:hypothetical protein [Streptomyces sp. NRRL B-1347]